MTTTPYPGPFSPDSPALRLPWILLLAIVLVLLALVALGRVLRTPTPPAHKHKPLRARIYELPATPGSAGAKHAPQSARRAPRHPAQRPPAEKPRPRAQAHTPATPHHRAAKEAPQHRHTALPTSPANKGVTLAHPGHRHHPASAGAGHRHHNSATHPTAPPHRARPNPRRTLNWGRLQSQINTAVQQAEPLLPQVHHPHTLVAHHYLASLLQRLQLVGDMNYPGNLTGVLVLKLVIGTHGNLVHVSLLRSSGNPTLDRDALRIARDSAPFPPFPDQLKRQTSHVTLICHMHFDGDRAYARY